MNKLEKIIKQTKAGFYLTINPHRDYYESILSYLGKRIEDIDADTLDIMTASDTLIILTVYPDTPVGCLIYYGYNLDKVLDEAIEDYVNR